MNYQKKIGEAVTRLFISFLVMLLVSSFGLLLAFPIKWTWNLAVTYILGLPSITWGKSWCLWFLSCSLIKIWPTEKKGKE